MGETKAGEMSGRPGNVLWTVGVCSIDKSLSWLTDILLYPGAKRDTLTKGDLFCKYKLLLQKAEATYRAFPVYSLSNSIQVHGSGVSWSPTEMCWGGVFSSPAPHSARHRPWGLQILNQPTHTRHHPFCLCETKDPVKGQLSFCRYSPLY